MKRRSLFQLLTAPAAAQQPESPPQRVPKEALGPALGLLGLEFTEAEQAMMLNGINRAVGQYETLRKIDIPLDTEPAFRFAPTRRPAANASRFRPTRVPPPRRPYWKSIEELAFLPVTQLAPLIRTRLVSSTELTRMYLERLKRYGPRLNCVTRRSP